MKQSRIHQVSAAAIWLTFLCTSRGDDFEIVRWTIDGGGATTLAGGPFELGGTIGQEDAGMLLSGDMMVAGGSGSALRRATAIQMAA